MLTHDLLIEKGFKLNEYPQGKYYELTETEVSKVENILKSSNIDYDPMNIDEKVILQLKEDFSNKLVCVDCNIWDLTEYEFEKILKNIEDSN